MASAGARGFTGTDSVAQVLRWRLAVSRDQLPDDGAWRGRATLTPRDGGGEQGRVVRQAAALLDAQVTKLGTLAGEQQPAWEERAGVVAAWREYAAVPDLEPTVLGPEPIEPQPMPRMLWRAAHQALGSPDDTPEWSRCRRRCSTR